MQEKADRQPPKAHAGRRSDRPHEGDGSPVRAEEGASGEAVDDAQNRKKSPRPQHLVLNRQHSSTSASSEDESSTDTKSSRNQKKDVPPAVPPPPKKTKSKEREQSKESQQKAEKPQPEPKVVPTEVTEVKKGQQQVGKPQHPAQAEMAKPDVKPTPEETIKKKPMPLDRKVVADHRDVDRNVSPGKSTKSPRSPPRSPNWMRYRESPPRSPPVRSVSPKSPTERFPSNYVDLSPTHDETQRPIQKSAFPFENESDSVSSLVSSLMAGTVQDGRVVNDKPPPKPARALNQYDFHEDEDDDEEDEQHAMAAHALDVASYAATVANEAAHLANMSVSPTNLIVPEQMDPELLEVSPEQESISPPSPNYYEEVDDIEVAEPTPKSIDYQNSKRQKAKPPATDWSPITDLSPILDVSPSIERLEHEKMIAEQQRLMGKSEIGQPGTLSSPSEESRKSLLPKTKTQEKMEQRLKEEYHSSLRRYERIEDISALSGDGEQASMAPRREMQRSERMENINEMIHNVRPLPEASAEALKKIEQDGDSHDSLESEGISLSDLELKQTYHRVEKEEHILSDAEREIDLDADIPPKKWESKEALKKIPDVVPYASKPVEKTVHITEDLKDSRSVQDRRKEYERQVSLSNSKSSASKDSNKPDSGPTQQQPPAPAEQPSTKAKEAPKVKPHPLELETSTSGEDDRLISPHYRVLTSPTSPRRKVVLEGYPPSPQSSPRFTQKERAYLYPSPGTPPASVSPPTPRSPSLVRSEAISSPTSPPLSWCDIESSIFSDHNKACYGELQSKGYEQSGSNSEVASCVEKGQVIVLAACC